MTHTCHLLRYMAATWREPNTALADALTSTAMGEGMYSKFLGWNVVGHCVCLAGSLLGFAAHQLLKIGKPIDAEPTVEDPATGVRTPRPGYEALAAAAGVAQVTAAKESASAAEPMEVELRVEKA